MNKNDSNLNLKYDVEYYSANIKAWYTIKVLKNKYLINLSACCIGLLLTTDIRASLPFINRVDTATITCFMLCIVSALLIFIRWAYYIDKIILDSKQDKDAILVILDAISNTTFVLGIISFFILIIQQPV